MGHYAHGSARARRTARLDRHNLPVEQPSVPLEQAEIAIYPSKSPLGADLMDSNLPLIWSSLHWSRPHGTAGRPRGQSRRLDRQAGGQTGGWKDRGWTRPAGRQSRRVEQGQKE